MYPKGVSRGHFYSFNILPIYVPNVMNFDRVLFIYLFADHIRVIVTIDNKSSQFCKKHECNKVKKYIARIRT